MVCEMIKWSLNTGFVKIEISDDFLVF